MPYGPQKLILIRSGRYDYAEVDLSGSLHIVGLNNTGKTTLINTLQFLYLDDQRRMDFGAYTHDQTRHYYFPGQYSYVLFQCLGVSGQCVMGWRGQSKTGGGDPERFTHAGPYEASDFLDENQQVREVREVNARLALKGYRVLKSAQEHRELLLQPSGRDAKGLSIVSLRNPDRYGDFRESLKDLLSLSTITQDQMRDRLLMLADISAEKVALDARKLFGEDYDRIRQRRDTLARFKQESGAVKELIARFQLRESLRGALIYRWTDLKARHKHYLAEHQALQAELRQTVKETEEHLIALAGERASRLEEKEGFLRESGALNGQLASLAEHEKQLAAFNEDLARAALANLKNELLQLQMQLAASERETRERALQKLELYQDMVRRKKETMEHFDKLVVTALRKRFTDPELDPVFSLLNFDLLESRLGDAGVMIQDETALMALLAELVRRTRDGAYRDATVTVQLPQGRKALADLADPETIRVRLAEDQETLEHWEGVWRAIEQREQIARQKREIETECDQQQRALIRFEEFQKANAEAPRIRAELKKITAAIDAAKGRLDDLEHQIKQADKRIHECTDRIRKSDHELTEIENRFIECRFPEFSAPPAALGDIPNDFDAAIALFLRDQGAEEKLALEVASGLREIEVHFGDRFTGAAEEETVRALQSELDALPDQLEALARDWNAHIHGLKGQFDLVIQELSEIHSAKDRLNREFSRVPISNIKSVRLDVIETGDSMTWIRRLAEMEQPGLFDDTSSLDKTLANFRRVLENNPVVRYASLFTLRFTVEGEDGVAHRYQDFRQIESHGTTITIKVLFNLLVLKSLLRKDDSVVPFFLDEVQTLDPANRHAVLTTARKLGFIAITAAPDAITEVDSLYFLQPRQGRIVLTDRQRLDLKLNAP